MNTNTRQNVLIGAGIAGVMLLIFDPLRQAVINLTVGIGYLATGVLRRIPRTIYLLIEITVVALVLVAIAFVVGVFTGYWIPFGAMCAFLGILSLLLLRASNFIPTPLRWQPVERAIKGLATLTMLLFFLGMLALAAPDILPTLDARAWLMLVLFAFFMSAYGTAFGTGGVWGRRIMTATAVLLVAAIILPQLLRFDSNPVLVFGREAVVATRDRSASELLNFARRTTPEIPIDLDKINLEAQRQIIKNEISRYETLVAGLVAISATRSLTDDEITALGDATLKIKQRQTQLQNLGSSSDNAQTNAQRKSLASTAGIRILLIAGLTIALTWLLIWLYNAMFAGASEPSTGGANATD